MDGVATWNVGGPQDAKWAEFVVEPLMPLYSALQTMMADPESGPNQLEALKGFHSARARLVSALVDRGGFDKHVVAEGVEYWATLKEGMSVRDGLGCDGLKDPMRLYSWGDRHFPDRPTVLNADPRLDPALFKCTSVDSSPVPRFRRFEKAWIDYMFQLDPKGNIWRVIPPNKYMVTAQVEINPMESQIQAYFDLFYYDWAMVYLFHILETTTFTGWYTLRESMLRQKDPQVRMVHSAKFITQLTAKCHVVALQELNFAQIEYLAAPLSSSELVLPAVQSTQMAGLVVRDPSTILRRDVLADAFPEADVLSSRVASVVTRSPSEGATDAWMYVSVHCKPAEVGVVLDRIIAVVEQLSLDFDLTTVVLMGDLNTTRTDLGSLAAMCCSAGFRSTWEPLIQVPDTVNNLRTKWIQPQIGKDQKVNRAPKDHVFVWTRGSTTPKTTTRVIVNDELDEHASGTDLVIGLPSDHVGVLVEFC